MKKILTVIAAGLMMTAQVLAVTTKDVCGQFHGLLNIGGQVYPDKKVYLLPGTVENTLTFVLPDFTFGAKGKLGNIVLPNIPMSAEGQLTLENATLYLDSISERATITILNGLEDEGIVYNSIVSNNDAQVLLSIAAPSLPEPILVLFAGNAVRSNNYALPNGGLEGAWTSNEPQGWHSFGTATGLMADFVTSNTYQFIPSTEVRPGSEGTQSAMLSSDMLFGVKANGNCTNGQINAGSMTADSPADNYNFSDPANNGFNTAFQGRPDSIVFWAKYQPADLDPTNEVNKARMSTIITTNARYQDPEADDYSAVKIGEAVVNYAATSSMGWQRIAVPFQYTGINGEPAYILTTFTTNQVPGGGSSYTTGGSFSKKNVLDTVYLDDIELIYNKALTSFAMDADELQFTNHIATRQGNYCDDCAQFSAESQGQTAQTFIAFDDKHKCIHVYVIADDFAQSGEYNLYRVTFFDSQTDDLEPITEGIEELFLRTDNAKKVIMDGQLFIRHGNNWYNAAGIRVK